MSQPMRYEMLKMTCSKCEQVDAELQGAMTTHDAGRWVKWDDYAALAADRTKWINLSVEHEKEVAELQGKVAALAAENERLRKAGDEMYEVCKENWEYSLTGSLDDYIENKPHKLPHTYHLCQSWNAAKEGGAK